MATLPQSSLSDRRLWEEQWLGRLAQIVIVLAQGRTRAIILLLAAGFCGWQLYVFAWRPLLADTALPEGIISVRAELNATALAEIREARAARLQHAPASFRDADQYFAASQAAP